jgi:peptidoglycan hydrolase-like protein with peptidoglycan-binding domain
MSYGAPRKRYSHSATRSAAARSTKTRSNASKARYRRSVSTYSRRSSQPAPTPERYKEIQQALATKGYYKGEVSGVWGPDSVDGLRRFQADQNLDVDGKIGSLSLIAMGLGPKRTTAQAKPEQPVVQPNQPVVNKEKP